MPSRRRFDAEEDAYILKHAGELTWRSIAEHLDRSTHGIRKRARALGHQPRLCRRWTPQEDATILAARGRTLENVAEELGRNPTELSARARVLGIPRWVYHKNNDTFKPRRGGYKVVGFTRRNGKGWTEAVLEHRVVAEEILGRPLRDGECAHHVNCDKSDNRRENIHVFSSRGEHRKAHASIELLVGELFKRGIVRFDSNGGVYTLC